MSIWIWKWLFILRYLFEQSSDEGKEKYIKSLRKENIGKEKYIKSIEKGL